jgi:hypothetical protein
MITLRKFDEAEVNLMAYTQAGISLGIHGGHDGMKIQASSCANATSGAGDVV